MKEDINKRKKDIWVFFMIYVLVDLTLVNSLVLTYVLFLLFKVIRKKSKLLIVKLRLGIKGLCYKETRYLKFKSKNNFYYEIRDRKCGGMFLVDRGGKIIEIYNQSSNCADYEVGSYIDISDLKNIYIPHETRIEMMKFEVTKNYLKENIL